MRSLVTRTSGNKGHQPIELLEYLHNRMKPHTYTTHKMPPQLTPKFKKNAHKVSQTNTPEIQMISSFWKIKIPALSVE